MELLPQLWPQTVGRDGEGRLTVGGVDVVSLAAEHGTAAYVLDEDDFRARARRFRDEFAAAFAGSAAPTSTTRARRSCAPRSPAGSPRRACSSTSAPAASSRSRSAPASPAERIGLHGNNKSVAEIREALAYGVGRIVVDSFNEIDRVAAVAAELGVVAPVMVRVTVGVEAHTHEFIATAHEDQKFGFSLAGGQRRGGRATLLDRPELDLRGLHSHIGSQIFDTGGFEIAARRLVGLHADIAASTGTTARARPRRRLRHRLHLAAHPAARWRRSPTRWPTSSSASQGRRRRRHPHLPRVSVEPGRAIVGPSTFTLYKVGTVKDVELGDGHCPQVRLRRRRHERQHPHRALRRRLLLHARQPPLRRAAAAVARRRQALRERRHRRPGRVPARRPRPGDLVAVPGTGAYCRSMASQYNHTPRPPVVAVREGGPACSCGARPSRTCWPSTWRTRDARDRGADPHHGGRTR